MIRLILLFAAALIPPAFLLFYIYKKDTVEKEPPSLLLKLFIGGVLATIVAMIGETIGETILGSIFPYGGILSQVLMAFCVVGLVEEGGKLIFLKLFSWKSPAFNYVFDAIVYAVFVSLGFAALENVLYVFQYGFGTAASRAIFSIPGHMGFSVIMGLYYGRAKLCEAYGDLNGKKSNLRKALLYSLMVHGFYDACLFISSPITIIVFYIFYALTFKRIHKLVKQAAFFDRPIPTAGMYSANGMDSDNP